LLGRRTRADVFVVTQLLSERETLSRDESVAEQSLLAAHAQMSEAQRLLSESLARLSQLRARRAELEDRGKFMVRRGLESLDDLGDDSRAESEAVVDAQSHGALDAIDWNAVLSDPFVFDGSPSGAAERPSGSS
jgi:uncharacterized membrane protein YccC